MKTILKRVPAEFVDYDFVDQTGFGQDGEDENILICGNWRFISFGDQELLDVLAGDYYDSDTGYDYEPLEELEKLTEKKWHRDTFSGYSQSDWQYVYYTDDVSEDRISELEAFYMDKVDEYFVYEQIDPETLEDADYDYSVYIPHDVTWKGKEAICEYVGFKPEDTLIYEDDGYEKVYKYKIK